MNGWRNSQLILDKNRIRQFTKESLKIFWFFFVNIFFLNKANSDTEIDSDIKLDKDTKSEIHRKKTFTFFFLLELFYKNIQAENTKNLKT